jgi:hypothetical protein
MLVSTLFNPFPLLHFAEENPGLLNATRAQKKLPDEGDLVDTIKKPDEMPELFV